MFDADQDGNLNDKELDKCPGLKAAVAQVDTIGDGKITAAKIAARITQWQKAKLGRIPCMCIVLHNGKPLADADVKFVPEKFLGDNIQTSSGKTDSRGVAKISVPTSAPTDPQGVSPGFYRVEITMLGDHIPPMYNNNTILGQEVARDAKAGQQYIRFDLKY